MAKLCKQHPVRCSRYEKQSFLAAAANEFESLGFECSVLRSSSLGILSEDLIAGSLISSRVIIAAHYDTPRLPLVPLRVYPASSAKSALFALPFVILPLLIAIFISRLTGGGAYTGGALFVLLFIAFCGIVPAQQSSITTDSGIESLFLCAEQLGARRADVAYVLTDNRHTFGLGASLLARECRPDAVVICIEGVGGSGRLAVFSRNAQLALALADNDIPHDKSAFRIPLGDERAFTNSALITAVDAHLARTMGKNEPPADSTLANQASGLIINFIERGI